MFQVRRSMAGNRSQSGKLDILIITLIAVLLIAGFAYVIFQIVGHSEEHVDTVRKTKVIYKESLRWRPDSDLCEARISQDLVKLPNRTVAEYTDLNLDEKSVKLIAQMSNLQKLNLDRSTMRDPWIDHLRKLPHLTNLSLEGNPISDRAIPTILKMENLQRLSIGDTEVTDAGLEMLSSHRGLTHLVMNLCRSATNDGVKHLSKLSKLKSLELSNPVSLTGKCLPNLKDAKILFALSVDNMPLSSEDLTVLSGLKNLNNLDVANCQLNDAGMIEISKISSLRNLNLTGDDISDKGLMLLTKLKKLYALRIKDCPRLDEKMVAKFRAAMPRCAVEFSRSSDISEKMNRKDVKQSVEFLQEEVRQELHKVQDVAE